MTSLVSDIVKQDGFCVTVTERRWGVPSVGYRDSQATCQYGHWTQGLLYSSTTSDSTM